MNNILRRRALMEMFKGSAEEYALTKKDQPVILAAFYNAGLCASPDYMTIEEAGLITNSQFSDITFESVDFNGEDFSGFKWFTGITQIPNNKFKNCNISRIILPNTVTHIGTQGFAESNITNIDLTYITSASSFICNQCAHLTKAIIGPSTPMREYGMFRMCFALNTVICKATTPPTFNEAFGSLGTTRFIVYVPDNSVSAYQANEQWGVYIIKGMSEYVES